MLVTPSLTLTAGEGKKRDPFCSVLLCVCLFVCSGNGRTEKERKTAAADSPPFFLRFPLFCFFVVQTLFVCAREELSFLLFLLNFPVIQSLFCSFSFNGAFSLRRAVREREEGKEESDSDGQRLNPFLVRRHLPCLSREQKPSCSLVRLSLSSLLFQPKRTFLSKQTHGVCLSVCLSRFVLLFTSKVSYLSSLPDGQRAPVLSCLCAYKGLSLLLFH